MALNFGQCFLSCLPQAAVARGNFPRERPSSKAPQGHAAGFRGLHLPRGDGVLLHPVSEEREADSTLSDPGHPHAREKEVAQRAPSRPWPGLPPRAGSRSLRSAPPPPRAASGNEPAAKAAWGLGRPSPSLRVGRPRSRSPPPRLAYWPPAPWSPPFSPRGSRPGGCRGRGAAARIPARGRRRHHVSGPGRRGRSGPCPAPRARAHTRGGAGSHPHPTPAQPRPGLPGPCGCLLLDGAMGPFWERKGKNGHL